MSALKKLKKELNQALLDGTKIQRHRNMKKECRDGALQTTDGAISLHCCFRYDIKLRAALKIIFTPGMVETPIITARREN